MTSKRDEPEARRGDDLSLEVRLPGTHELREAVANYARRRIPKGKTIRQDGLAGLNTAIYNVSDGMANAVLIGVNPIHGLYATIVGPLLGGIFSSTQVMVITTTAAASLTAAQSLSNLPPESLPAALFVMVVLVGMFQILFGLLKLGRLIRFVSYSVTTGLLTGIAVLLILSKLPLATGIEVEATNRLVQTFELVVNVGQLNVGAFAVAATTLTLAVLLPRTKLGNVGRLVAIVVPSVLAVLLGMRVEAVGDMPRGIPMPSIPSFTMAFDVFFGALAVALVILVQGAGVSQSVTNPDDSRSRISRDFMAQGAANVASGFFRGLPVGGSVSATALSVTSGAVTRWSAIFAGLWMAVIVLLFSGLVAYVAMPALGALLILVGIQAIKPADIRSVWRAGWRARAAGLTTFLAMLILPIQYAVGLGVVLSMLLHVIEESSDISLVELTRRPDGRIEERTAPKQVPGGQATVLDVYGHLFFAGARTLERLLPPPADDAEYPVVILRMRGRTHLGATVISILSSYAGKLQKAKGRLYLTGLSETAHRQATSEGKLDLSGPVRAYEVTPIVGESTQEAYTDAQAWLVEQKQAEPT
ncbi:SulP family inorganic anion transporter [Phycisphaerales bacterium AB-hyl4]|uniref:SulP family inorganic anion transporter n=1 Tax=Natronomicrosphaera hydrolytica TaxID=3242702 RepID=A0ABV4U8Z5_9BACT